MMPEYYTKLVDPDKAGIYFLYSSRGHKPEAKFCFCFVFVGWGRVILHPNTQEHIIPCFWQGAADSHGHS